jgi:hypothetical protein
LPNRPAQGGGDQSVSVNLILRARYMTLASIPVTWAIGLFHWIVEHPAWSVAILLVPAALVGWTCRRPPWYPIYRWVLAAISVLAILFYAYVGVTYCQSPQFHDHIEPQVATVSYLLLQGKPVYLPPTAADQYSMLYGPFTYIWVAGYYWLMGPSIFTAKVSGVASGLAGVALLLAALKRSGSWWTALPCTALATTLYYCFEVESLWCRSDSHEVLLISLSVFALTLANPWLAAVLIGVSAGINVNVKVTALFYFFPIVTAFILRYRRWGPAALAAAVAIVVAATPFLFPEISPVNYLAWLRAASHHPLDWEDFRNTFSFAGWMVAMLLILGMPSIWSNRSADPQATRDWWKIAAALGVAIVFTLPFASKNGAGPHHLMPLVPILVWLVVRSWSIENSTDSPPVQPRLAMRHLLILPIAIVAIIYAGACGYAISSGLRKSALICRAVVSDEEMILDSFPDRTIEMGVGGDRTYGLTYVRPVLVFAGNPYHLDPAAAMDSAEAQHGLPAATADLCRSGLADIVLIPSGERPFTYLSWYPGKPPVFSPQFVQAFADNYHVGSTSLFFDIYVRNSITNPDSRPH